VFESVRFTDRLTVTAYTYAIDRVYGNQVPGPRLYYRRGLPDAMPAVIGDTLLRTDALRFRLNPPILDAVLNDAIGQPRTLRGEVILRAVRTFLSRFGGAGPFQSDTLRKAVAADWLDRGGDLEGFGVAEAVSTLDRLNANHYTVLASKLVEARFIGDDPDAYARSRERQTKWYQEARDALERARSQLAEFTAEFVRQVGRNLLIHTLAVAGHGAVCRLVGAGDDELQYFPRTAAGEFYVFDAVEGGNGFAETASRFFHVPPQRQRAAVPGTLPAQDGFDLFAESTAACPAQAAFRVVFESTARNAEIGDMPPAAGDLRSRVEREYHPMTGARPVLAALLAVPAVRAVLRRFEDLLWVQVVPEWFALQVRDRDVVRGFSDFQTRVHGCVTGCYECLDNGDGSVYGPVHAREHISRGLLDDLRRLARLLEPSGFAAGPPTTTAPVRATLDPTLTSGPLLARTTGGWEVAIPTLTVVRDDREGV
jgi:hypothetical protein